MFNHCPKEKMKIMILALDEKIINLNVDHHGTAEDLKALLEVQTGVPVQQQQILIDGEEMINSERLRAYGVKNGDLVEMKTVSPSRTSHNYQLGFNPDGSAVNPAELRERILNDRDMMARIYMNDPELAEILWRGDLNWLQLFLRTRHSQRAELQLHQDEELALLYADQSDPEVRRKIKEWDDDLKEIRTYNPLQKSPYVEVEINGISLKALVDTGAQKSVMAKKCAERCGLLTLIDESDTEKVVGVGGDSRSFGRINIAPMKIGNLFCLNSFMVLESLSTDCIFGMDMLRKNQCIVDIKTNVLRIRGGRDVPLLNGPDNSQDSVSELQVSSSRYMSEKIFAGS